ncbi:MAG: beta-N-acetylhexosaminidase [Acidiferrobacter sp.]
MSLGPVMIDLVGVVLSPDERRRLKDPLVGGVILFSRNYESPSQLGALTDRIHALRDPPLIIAVDHEGGRVQRFRAGFTPLPSSGQIGALYAEDRAWARLIARSAGLVMAAELLVLGVDISFAPVLDIGRGLGSVIGDRAFHSDPLIVAELARQYISGMTEAGMAATGKHFPGHGGVAGDSHLELPVDDRSLKKIEAEDLLPFARLAPTVLAGIMPAHCLYPDVDPLPAGFSSFWLKEVLRRRLRFNGVIFSDDLSMVGAAGAGDLSARAHQALAAGCDMVLACNCPDRQEALLAALAGYENPAAQMRLMRMHGRPAWGTALLAADPDYQQACQRLARLTPPS